MGEDIKKPSTISAKDLVILTKSEIRQSNVNKWALDDKKYKWTYNEVGEYMSMSDYEEETNSRLLVHTLNQFKSTCNYDDAYKSIIAESLYNSIIDNIKMIDMLTDNFDQKEFVCKLESLIDNVE